MKAPRPSSPSCGQTLLIAMLVFPLIASAGLAQTPEAANAPPRPTPVASQAHTPIPAPLHLAPWNPETARPYTGIVSHSNPNPCDASHKASAGAGSDAKPQSNPCNASAPLHLAPWNPETARPYTGEVGHSNSCYSPLWPFTFSPTTFFFMTMTCNGE